MERRKGQRYSNEFRRGAVEHAHGSDNMPESRESSAYVAEHITTGVIDWTGATHRLREPAS